MRMLGTVERALLWFGVALAIHVPAHAWPAQVDSFAPVQQAVDSGEFARALTLAKAEPDPLTALRTEVWVYYAARDFEAAWETCERGLQLAPADAWLAERSSAAALWLRDPVRTNISLQRFERTLEQAQPAARESFLELLSQARLAASELVAQTALARDARSRARICSIAILAAVLCAMGFVGLRLRKPA